MITLSSKAPSPRFARRLAGSVGAGVLAATLIAGSAQSATLIQFADFTAAGKASNIEWANNIVPETVTHIPAVTQFIPAVTQFIPAVTKLIPAVTKIVNGKVVVITPAHTIIVTPAHTITITPAHTIIITPAKTIIHPAHDGTSGQLFTLASASAKTFGLAKVSFAFMNKKLATLGPLDATFSFQATSPANDPAGAGAALDEHNLSGTFTFLYAGIKPLHVWTSTYLPGANLLTGVVSGFDLTGLRGGTTGLIDGSTQTGGTVSYTSDFLNFAGTNDRAFGIGFGYATPVLSADPGAALHTTKVHGAVGGFSADTRPHTTAVPEPQTWAMLLLGFGLTGAAMRASRRRLRTAV